MGGCQISYLLVPPWLLVWLPRRGGVREPPSETLLLPRELQVTIFLRRQSGLGPGEIEGAKMEGMP